MTRRLRWVGLLVMAVAAVASCGDTPTQPAPADSLGIELGDLTRCVPGEPVLNERGDTIALRLICT